MTPSQQLNEIIRLTVIVSRHDSPTTTDYYEALNRRNELVRELQRAIGRIPEAMDTDRDTCPSCIGTGIGNPHIEGSVCSACRGRGVIADTEAK